MVDRESCPCGSGQLFAQCCEPFLADRAIPQTVEQLMRSRYTAYTLRDEAYLLRTWHPSTRPARLDLSAGEPVKWLGLSIIRSEGDAAATHGTVEFVARYKPHGRAARMHEVSRFAREEGRWFYLNGDVEPE
jgi:SEC-C motif-containing protein